jgi:NADPH:quinone reductase-like Zn-dependent oxidoreductase
MLGVDEVINYVKTPDWAAEVLRLTGGVGADHVMDVAGGDGINDSVRAAKVAGRVSVIGFLTGQTAAVDLMPVIFRQTKVQGICVGHLKAFEEMNVAFDRYGIKPVVERVYGFGEAIEAYRHLERGAFGKIVIKIG